MRFNLSTYSAKSRLVLTLSTLAIIVLPFLNILRLDIPTLRFYFLNTVLWVDEFYLLFLILMLGLWIIVFSMTVFVALLFVLRFTRLEELMGALNAQSAALTNAIAGWSSQQS